MQPFFVYILKCGDGSYYTGHTDDLVRRLKEHQEGISNCYTIIRRPLTLVFYEEFVSRNEAVEAEKQIKGWTRKKKEALINRDWNALLLHAKKRFHTKNG